MISVPYSVYFGRPGGGSGERTDGQTLLIFQALGRKRRDNKRVKELEAARRTMDTVAPSGEGAATGGEGEVMGYTVDTAK